MGVSLLTPVVGSLVPESNHLFGVLVVPLEVLSRKSPPLASILAHHPEPDPMLQTPVYVAPVSLPGHGCVDGVQDRGSYRAGAIPGLKSKSESSSKPLYDRPDIVER